MTFEFKKLSINAIFIMLVIAFVFLSYVHGVLKTAAFSNFGDFGNYYFYAKALRLNYNIYSLDDATTENLRKEFAMPEFVYGAGHSPIFFTLIGSFTFLGYRLASIIWLLLNNIFFIGSILVILKLVFEKITDIDRDFMTFSSIFLVLSFQPLIEDIFLGQINLLILFLFANCLYFLNKEKYMLAGIMLSLGILIKLHLGILLLFFLWKRCYRVFFSAVISFIALEMLGLFLNGTGLYYQYWDIVIIKFFPGYLTDTSMFNLSLKGLINRLINLAAYPGLINAVFGFFAAFTLALFVYVFYVTKDRFKDLDLKFILEFSLMIIFIFIVSPVVHEHHYVLLYLPIIFLWAELSRNVQPAFMFLFITSFLLIGLGYSLIRFTIFSKGALAIFSAFKLYGVILLFFLTLYKIKQYAKNEIKKC